MTNIDTYAGALLAVVCIGALILWALALCRSAARPRPSQHASPHGVRADELNRQLRERLREGGWKP